MPILMLLTDSLNALATTVAALLAGCNDEPAALPVRQATGSAPRHAIIRIPRHMRLRMRDSHPARLGADAGAMTRTVNSCIAGTPGTEATRQDPTVFRWLTLPCRYAASLALRCPGRCLTVGLTESLAKE